MTRTTRAVLAAVAAATCAAGLSGCSQDSFGSATDKLMAAAKSAMDATPFGAGAPPDAATPGEGAAGKKGGGKRAHLVELASVTIDTLRITSVYTGSLRPRQTVRIFNQEEGRVTALPFFEGDRVAANAKLLELDNALLSAELDKAVAVRKEVESNHKRLVRLRESKLVSEDEFVRAATAVEIAKAEEAVLRTRIGYTRVLAPFAGVVTARLVEPGDIVPKHTHVLTVIEPNSLVTDLEVSELLMPHLVLDQRVTVRIDALGDREFPGRVARIHPQLDARTRQGRIEVELTPVPDAAQPGQFARVRFAVEALGRKVLPFSALRRDADGEFVFRVDGDGRAQRTEVRSGRRLADQVEIVEGLADGDQVVVRGFLGLTDGMAVESVARGERRAGAG